MAVTAKNKETKNNNFELFIIFHNEFPKSSNVIGAAMMKKLG
jgi:hypothetical protein